MSDFVCIKFTQYKPLQEEIKAQIHNMSLYVVKSLIMQEKGKKKGCGNCYTLHKTFVKLIRISN